MTDISMDQNTADAVRYVATATAAVGAVYVVFRALVLALNGWPDPAAGPKPEYPPAVAEPACLHQWEKDGERIHREWTDEDGDECIEDVQPCRCTKCGEMRSFEL